MSNTIGQKIKQLRIKFDLSQKQATDLIGTGISHSSWAYWEKNGAPVERLAEIAKMTNDAKATYGWLTGTTGGQIPKIELVKEIPKGSGFSESPGSGKRKAKKKKTAGGHDRRIFTPQMRANILAGMDRDVSEGGSINGFCKARRLSSSMVGRWRTMSLPAPNGAAVPGIIEESEFPLPQSATDFTNLPQQPLPPPTPPGPKPGAPQRGGHRPAKVSKAKALITSQYLCPHCGSPVFLPEE